MCIRDRFKSDTGDDRLPQNPVGGGVGKYDKVEVGSRPEAVRHYWLTATIRYRGAGTGAALRLAPPLLPQPSHFLVKRLASDLWLN